MEQEKKITPKKNNSKNSLKIIFASVIVLLLIFGFMFINKSKDSPDNNNGNNNNTYPAITLPKELINYERENCLDTEGEFCTEFQELKSVTIRDLTDEENIDFQNEMVATATNDLNDEYKLIEFDFGKVTYIFNDKGKTNSFELFNEKTFFVLNEEVVHHDLIQINNRSKETHMPIMREGLIYGYDNENFKIKVLLKKTMLEAKGLQLKTTINNNEKEEIIYIDIN